MEYFVNIYDMRANTLYETKDISIGINCENGDLEQFIADAKDDVVEKSYIQTSSNTYGTSVTPKPATCANTPKSKKNEVKDPKSEPIPIAGRLNQSPGFYGGYGKGYNPDYVPDYDAEIFGKRNNWWDD